MTEIITIKKGLDIPIAGKAEKRLTEARGITTYAVKPTDYEGLVPRLLVAEGDTVTVGDALFCDKKDERIRFTSPVSGQVKAIVRGEKRKLLEVVVEATKASAPTYPLPQTADELKATLLQCGLWTQLRQRPFGIIANPDDQPKAIFITAFNSAPLAPDYDFVLQGREEYLKRGLEALTKLTDGKVHICFRPDQQLAKHLLPQTSYLKPHYIKGPHPAGNISTQMAHIDPLNKGEVVWTMNLQDVAVLGELVSTGVYHPERVIALVGPDVNHPQYYRITAGACVSSLLAGQIPSPDYPAIRESSAAASHRIISGDILTGQQIKEDGYLGAYDDMVSVLPEGHHSDFMGWLMPNVRKASFSKTFLSGFLPKTQVKPFGINLPRWERFWRFDTNMNGEERAYVMTGEFEKVFPFEIYPLQLIKACIVGDIELMENLGIYEVLPEDFALCEYIDTSKTNIQQIIRDGLEKVRKEIMP